MEVNESSPPTVAAKTRTLEVLQVLLRAMAVAMTLGSVFTMLVSKQSAVLYGVPLTARYTYSSALEFNVYADGVASGLCMVSLLFLLNILWRRQSRPTAAKYLYLFLHDLGMVLLVVAGLGSSAAVGWVAKYGNKHTGWMPICDDFPTFCTRISIAIALSLLSAIILLLLTLISFISVYSFAS